MFHLESIVDLEGRPGLRDGGQGGAADGGAQQQQQQQQQAAADGAAGGSGGASGEGADGGGAANGSAGTKRLYADSIESLMRNMIQKVKIDMASEVIDAGRFDMQTSNSERRQKLEELLADEDRQRVAQNEAWSMDEFNKKAARNVQEYELFGRLDRELAWPGALQAPDEMAHYGYLAYTQGEVDHVSFQLTSYILSLLEGLHLWRGGRGSGEGEEKDRDARLSLQTTNRVHHQNNLQTTAQHRQQNETNEQVKALTGAAKAPRIGMLAMEAKKKALEDAARGAGPATKERRRRKSEATVLRSMAHSLFDGKDPDEYLQEQAAAAAAAASLRASQSAASLRSGSRADDDDDEDDEGEAIGALLSDGGDEADEAEEDVDGGADANIDDELEAQIEAIEAQQEQRVGGGQGGGAVPQPQQQQPAPQPQPGGILRAPGGGGGGGDSSQHSVRFADAMPPPPDQPPHAQQQQQHHHHQAATPPGSHGLPPRPAASAEQSLGGTSGGSRGAGAPKVRLGIKLKLPGASPAKRATPEPPAAGGASAAAAAAPPQQQQQQELDDAAAAAAKRAKLDEEAANGSAPAAPGQQQQQQQQ